MNPGKVSVINRSVRLPTFTDNFEEINRRVYQLFRDQDIDPCDVRGMGISVDLLNNQEKSGISPKKNLALGRESNQSPASE
jgi:hypothetical protein